MKLVLASGSPRRKELLGQLAFLNTKADVPFEFEILAADIDESHNSAESAEEFVLRLAKEKALAGLALYAAEHGTEEQTVVLGSDTIVVQGETILGKPKDEADAAAILASLSGQSHRVMTAVALTDGSKTVSKLVTTKVQFCELTQADILAYIATGEPMDKAGAYGIQGLGGNFVEAIEGSYSAVVGLPLVETRALLCEMQVL
ncbi:Maf family nucleotide pyrophosphatase [Shewanella schlegeliana]|uniref:dTTP/UTP pyrophosphatase n=1 Tax=Shewanella schlegeliana TaxID=190308 RepID=A0ABS1SXB9_9GAMM|nr:Maf family protein [Shewanella schlegeliana]MBL4913000.1 septum formation inhibitor Maf [Shewanella schlegeliana]MCL1108904.1 Maf family nucleotide pyrophosphatase [Shewanella schlegeliana]GIU23752.1 Maf-like protein [Shewanella schlegeliana]